jgi:hypothetical protein
VNVTAPDSIARMIIMLSLDVGRRNETPSLFARGVNERILGEFPCTG